MLAHLIFVSCLIALACARPPTAYREARAAARRAYAHGRYLEAASEWNRAAGLADSNSNRVEAWYRRAASLKRAGEWQRAAAAYGRLLRQSPQSSRAARAAYERARIELEHGDSRAACRLFEHVLEAYPQSSVASGALDRVLDSLSSDAERRAYLGRWIEQAYGTELEQYARYQRARLTEKMELFDQAYREYLTLAERFPYPDGPYWDDALWYAAALDRRAGRYTRAIGLLRKMLARRESSHFSGSYERGRYSQARYEIARIYRDDLQDLARARDQFALFYEKHRTSRLRDDAKWQQARLSRALGDTAQACEALKTLADEIPESRFVGCAHALCPGIQISGPQECHEYIIRDLDRVR